MLFTKNSAIEFPNEIMIKGTNYRIEVGFFNKKNSSVSVKEGKLVFRLSSRLSNGQTKKHFEDLLSSISKKLSKTNLDYINEKNIEQILSDKFFYFNNEIFEIVMINGGRGVKLKDNSFIISSNCKKENIQKNIIKLLIDRYSERLKEYVQLLNSQTYNYTIKDIELKLVSSKWGHCSYDNKLMFNLKLLNSRKEILDYVIFHEISHIKHKNHSEKFWSEVSRFCPDYKLLRKELRMNPPKLFN